MINIYVYINIYTYHLFIWKTENRHQNYIREKGYYCDSIISMRFKTFKFGSWD